MRTKTCLGLGVLGISPFFHSGVCEAGSSMCACVLAPRGPSGSPSEDRSCVCLLLGDGEAVPTRDCGSQRPPRALGSRLGLGSLTAGLEGWEPPGIRNPSFSGVQMLAFVLVHFQMVTF